MKYIISVTLISIISLFVGGLEITFKPFKISFNSPVLMVGYLLLIVGFLIISFGMKKEGYKLGYTDGCGDTFETIKSNFNITEKEDENAPH